jgi:hypothetical protein
MLELHSGDAAERWQGQPLPGLKAKGNSCCGFGPVGRSGAVSLPYSYRVFLVQELRRVLFRFLQC